MSAATCIVAIICVPGATFEMSGRACIIMAAVSSLGPEPIQPTEEMSALAADASRRLFRLIGANLELAALSQELKLDT